ncbi:MAG: hypothetical protein AB1586_09090 [Pseudomonadota bacterium]
MSNITRRALRVYAVLSELRGSNQDILDALIPFFEPFLSLMDGKMFEPRLFALAMQRLYRWRFTKDVAEQFVPRLLRAGFLERRGTATDAVYIVRYKPPQTTTDEGPITAALESIIDEFEKFPPRVTDLLSYSRSREELTDILIRFLVSMDAYNEAAFMAELKKLHVQHNDASLLDRLEEGGTPLHRDDRYLAARFVQAISKETPSYVPILVQLSSIGLLTEVVEDFLKPTQVAATANLTAILDTPLALDYLGCSGVALRDDIRSIVTSLTAIGCRFVVFPVTCTEIQRNLDSLLSNDPSQRHGYTNDALLKNEVKLDFVRAVANDPETALRHAGITVRPMTLSQYPHTHIHFDASRYESYFESIYWVPDVAPREHDAECLTLTMRLREGKHNSDLFRSGYVFVTRNGSFVNSSRKYCEESRLITPRQEGPVIHQRELATIAWLRTGLGAENEIPRGHLIASCERVLRFRPEVKDAVAAKIREVTPENAEQFELLLTDAKSLRRLADETLNDENVVTSENAVHLFNVMKEATIAEEKARFDKKIADERVKRKQQQEIAERQRVSLEGERDEAIKQADVAKEQVRRVVADVARRANRTARYVERLIIAVMLLLLIGGTVDLLWGVLTGSKIWSAILVVVAGVSSYHLLMDVLQRPKVGVRSVMNWMVRTYFWRSVQSRGLNGSVQTSDIRVENGQIVLAGLPVEDVKPDTVRIEPRIVARRPAAENPPQFPGLEHSE